MAEMFFPRLLLIAGNGRESGKTTLACRLISRIGASVPVAAIKISSHQHDETRGISIHEEKSITSGKDSARMLLAGARISYYVSAPDDELKDIVPLVEELSANHFIVCESGGLRKFVEPGMFVIVNEINRKKIKESLQPLTAFSHVWMSFNGTLFTPDENKIYTDNDKWRLKK